MLDRTKVLIILFLTFIVLVILTLLFINLIRKLKNKKINVVFNKLKSLDYDFNDIYVVKNKEYDIYAESDFSKYYIKVISVKKNAYLKIDENYKYSLSYNGKEKNIDKSLKIKSYKFKVSDTEKRICKIIIIYPEISQKLYFKSPVEGRFIYPISEFQGVKVIKYSEIEELFSEQMI